MGTDLLLLLPVALPLISGVLLAVVPQLKKSRPRDVFILTALTAELISAVLCAIFARGEITLVRLSPSLAVTLRLDAFGTIFSLLVAVMWLLSGVFSHEYMEHEDHLLRYYTFFLLTEGALMVLCLAANYLTLYLGFELMTLASVPLVLHNGTKEARDAALKYLFYSVFGACLGLAGFFFAGAFGAGTEFVPGGVLDPAKIAGHESCLLVVSFLTIMGFGAKAGLFPLHAWLPTAHPEAPAGASAVLSGIITKAGVLAIFRVIFYVFGADFLRGTWVQYALIGLSLTTILLGSVLAFREKLLKKRLAYSTVSQVSYILFGLFLMEPIALLGAMLHVVCHAVIKDALFFSAGAVIHKTGETDVRALRGVGKKMPIVMWCFTIASLGLVGIPPLGGFVSKWYLATGSLASGAPVVSWLGPLVLIISALFTAGYLFSITVRAFFPGVGLNYSALEKREPSGYMTVPLILLALLTALIGIYPAPLMDFISRAASRLF